MGFISTIFIIAILIGVMSVFSLFRGVSKIFLRPDTHQSSFNRNNYTHNHDTDKTKSQKIFTRDEGVYVKYEEINE